MEKPGTDIEDLCRQIRMPQEVTEAVAAEGERLDFPAASAKLCHPDTWAEGLKETTAALGDDPRGLNMLAVMLRCARNIWPFYEEKGISRGIYVDTMACFSRFVREHRESYGVYGFDRAFWTVRQVSGRLFRIGELEYELTAYRREKIVSLHIPSDARLEKPLLRESAAQARALLRRCFPEYAEAAFCCQSWLLSPTLGQLLPPDSRILAFQRMFQITPLGQTGDSYVQWVFKDPWLALADYPEDTTLQRRLKAYLLAGGSFQEAEGIWKEDASDG